MTSLETIVNEAATAPPSTKGKKRFRDGEEAGSSVIKKRKKDTPVNVSSDDDSVQHIPTSSPSTEAPEEAPKMRRKKNKRAGALVDASGPSTTIHDPDDPRHATERPQQGLDTEATASLLSAIVAAAANSPRALDGSQTSNGSGLPDNHEAFLSTLTDPSLSNDDILRALQDLDLSKIASLLKSIGDTHTATPVPNLFLPHQSAAIHGPDLSSAAINKRGKLAAESSADSLAPKVLQNRTLDLTLPIPPEEANRDIRQAQILATKWLGAAQLEDLVKREGLIYKKGKFSAVEIQQLYAAIDNYRLKNGLNSQDVERIIFDKSTKERDNSFWTEITYAVPLRPLNAIYHHVRRAFHPMKGQGKWTPTEDARLEQAVSDLGMTWEKISQRVGRMAGDCRDRYRNHLLGRQGRAHGAWTKEEEEELTKIVTEMTVNQGRDYDQNVFWTQVAEKMGHRRSRQQCRIKWTDSLSKTVKNSGLRPRWSARDAFILVHKVASLNVRDDTEIDWKMISDADWNFWSPHILQRRWLTMKRSIKGYEDMTHHEIMEILRTKKSHCPPPAAIRKPATSAEIIEDDEEEDELEDNQSESPSPVSRSPGVTNK